MLAKYLPRCGAVRVGKMDLITMVHFSIKVEFICDSEFDVAIPIYNIYPKIYRYNSMKFRVRQLLIKTEIMPLK